MSNNSTSSEKSKYQKMGYDSREDYLKSLSEQNGVPLNVVHELSFVLGESEDFDGLVVEVEDYAMLYGGF